ncbi:uncharacterized protein LOC128219737 isoform X2 [Mya arenaria]|uniref:uncharacterized protein LOC128219737 isoform X2 n=1 Tax=Mya arenaria TaxID=6604 RepID=UPI0022E58790|nr:uncharacterized protein LOC128219737 isoform X2 [Mya arenaria]
MILGMTAEARDDPKMREISTQVHKGVSNCIESQFAGLDHGIGVAIETNWKMAAMNYAEQDVLRDCVRMRRQIPKNLSRAILAVPKSGAVGEKDLEFLSHLLNLDLTLHPWNNWKLAGDKVMKISEKLAKSEIPLMKVSNLPTEAELFVSEKSRLMDLAVLWGHGLKLKANIGGSEEELISTDFNWLMEIVNKLLTAPAPRSCDLCCLGDKVPCWTENDVMKMLPENTTEAKTLLLEMLKEKGYLLTFPIDVWSSMKDVSFVYVRYSDLPKAAPELMKQYWPDNDNIGPRVKQKEKFYFCAPGLPQTFFATLLREMFALGPPTLAWQTGALFLRTYLTVLVEIYPHVSDKYQVIVLQIRGNASSSTFPQDPLWTTLKLYSNIIDMMMMINTIPAVKAVMCSKCKDKSSAEELLSKFVNWKGHFLMEFLVREEHHLRCGICKAQPKRDAEIGPALSTADLVPNHDQKGCALGTTNPLNRCLMCQNCAVDGVRCNVNLKHGIKNWHCDCDREAKLCSYCGMCQRCFLAIKKTAAILEPKFDPLSKGSYAQDQMIADDKVKVTEKGSMYGFIEVDTIKTLDRSVLTPNYSPNMEVTLLSEGFFGLDLAAWERRGQGPIGVHYYSKSGVSKTNIKGVDKVGTPMPCNHGDTISIALRYKEMDALSKANETGNQELFENMQLTLKLNGTTFFELDLGATQVTVTICNNESESVFLQVQTPGKFTPPERKPSKDKSCGPVVANLPCSVEMKLINLLDGMEFVCFGGKGISLSGSPCVVMPEEKTLGMLKHPTWSTYKDVRIHHMCLTWNASLSKKTVLGPSSHKETPSQLPPFGDRIKSGEWAMSKLVHLIDNEGINPVGTTFDVENNAFLMCVWQFILTTYPEILLPETTDQLLGPGIVNEHNIDQVKEGLRHLLKAGMWLHYSRIDLDHLRKSFAVQGSGGKIFKGEFLTTKNELVRTSTESQEISQDYFEKTGYMVVTSKFNRNLELYLCPGHKHTMINKTGLEEIPKNLYGKYSLFVTFIDLQHNDLTHLPKEFFENLPNVTHIAVGHNFIQNLPSTIGCCKKLLSLQIHENNISKLPDTFADLKLLQTLDIGNNCFPEFPPMITKITSLTRLLLHNSFFTDLPEDIGNLKNLRQLHFQGNCLSKLPESFRELESLEELILSGVHWIYLPSNKETITRSSFKFTIRKKFSRWLYANRQDWNSLFSMFDENQNGVLDAKEVGKLNATVFNLFPRFGYKGNEPPDEDMPHGFPMQICSCKKLEVLYLKCQGITRVPPEIRQLEKLIDLQLSHNPNLISIPAELSELSRLKKLELDDCPMLKTPPREIRDKGVHSIMGYLKSLMSGDVLSKRTKLMLVGLGGAGKTSLVKALLSDNGKMENDKDHDITDGIDIKSWEVKHEDETITYNMWDFAGQTVYYNTHQFFLSPNRAIYLLLWNVRLGHEHAGLDFWLNSICVQAPKAPVFVIGSHIDQVSKSELPLEEMQQKFPQVVGFHFVSSFTGQGIAELKKHLFEVSLQQPYMGEHIPSVWLEFEKNIQLVKRNADIIAYTEMEKLAYKCGLFEPSEIYQAVQFLHDLGVVQYFTNEYLKSKVVINPQWIVDVMSCVVSVKSNVITDGRLKHDDVGEIWSNYGKGLHSWLLRLTEEFDLTFELPEEKINLVPCLLPEAKPKFEWPVVEKGSDIRETKMVYTFDYLPVGLFNRAQVRLHGLSDKSLIWKKGSFLKKNVHLALIQQTKDTEMVVIAQGPRPDNIQFLVHEIFEGLISESFHGITYDFTMPCPECQKMGVKDGHMFSASTIRRALEMKAPFLQCVRYFHTISCVTLQTLLPPDNQSDFDLHLVQCVQGLQDLHKELTADIFISLCANDCNLSNDMYIQPPRVLNDLRAKGFKCFFHTNNNGKSTDEMAKALIESRIFLAFVSMNYAQDEACVNIFKYARRSLNKTIVIVAIGDDFGFEKTRFGILIPDEVYINMTKPKLTHYDTKFDELVKTLNKKMNVRLDELVKPAVFFSYSWVNSQHAVSLGTREIPGALGEEDPRELKTYLESNGIPCWIDEEQIGMNGLIEDIAEGLLCAKVVVVCVSDEYAKSPTCQIEFRYAVSKLKLPPIFAVVGSGDSWRETEIGYVSVQHPVVYLQEHTKNSRKKLLKLVREKLASSEGTQDRAEVQKAVQETNKNLSYLELFELAQRKLSRQLMMFAENQDLDIYPRLFVVDFVKEQMDAETDEESIEEKFEKEDIAEKKKLGRPMLKRQMSRKSTNMIPLYKLQKFCVYTLCEHDEGWHSVAEPIELPASFGVESLEGFGPYLARITTVMKFNKRLPLNCLAEGIGEGYIEWLERSPEANLSDYQNVYHTFREMVSSLDEDKKMGGLQRCHLASGKTIWLCEDHRKSMKVTLLSNDDHAGSSLAKEKDDKATEMMMSMLRTMDYSAFKGEFKSNGNATRPRSEMLKFSKGTKYTNQEESKKQSHQQNRRRPRGKKSKGADEDVTDSAPKGTAEEQNNSEAADKKKRKANKNKGGKSLRFVEEVVDIGKSLNEKKGGKSTEDVVDIGKSTLFDEEMDKDDGISEEDSDEMESEPESVKSEVKSEAESVKAEGPVVRPPATRRENSRPLPGQSKYKIPGYKNTSRACEIS